MVLAPLILSGLSLAVSLLVLAGGVLVFRQSLPRKALVKLDQLEAELQTSRGEQRTFLLQAEAELEAMETLAGRIETKRRQVTAQAQRAQQAAGAQEPEQPEAPQLDPVTAANLAWTARKAGRR